MEKIDVAWEILFGFFLDIKDCKKDSMKKEQLQSTKDPNSNHSGFHHLVQLLVYQACKLWRSEEDDSFLDVLKSVRQFDPSSVDLMTIIQVETYAHHKYDNLDRDALRYVDSLARIWKQLNDLEANTKPVSQV